MRLGVTRSEAMLSNLKGEADKRHVELFPLPLQKIEYLTFEYPSELLAQPPDWILFSSAAGVESFFARLKDLGITLSDSVSFAVVGDKTATALKSLDLTVSFIPSEAYGENLFKEFIEQIDGSEKILYARGEKVNFDPAILFDGINIEYLSIICYRTIKQDIDHKLVDCFTEKDYILYTAPSTVEAYQSQFGRPKAIPIAIGRTTAKAMQELGWKEVVTMTKPDVDRVMEYLI